MTDHNPQFDDELLSAYLDDELSAEDRARVDRRLAADPAASKLLEELQAVSLATRELPSESLDADLRDTILRRAERAMLLSPAGEPASAGGTPAPTPGATTRFTLGRSPRGWLWAGAAIAAALMLMVVQQEPEQNKDLPGDVAARSDESHRDANVDAADRLEMRALTEESSTFDEASPSLADAERAPAERPTSVELEPAGLPSPPAAAQPTGGALVVEDLAESEFGVDTNISEAQSESKSRPEPATVASTTDASPARPPASASRRASSLSQSGGIGGSAPAAIDANGDADHWDWLVVHLRCPSTAIEQKVLDQTLINNNIAVEETAPPQDESLASDRRFSQSAAGRVEFQSQIESTTTPATSTDDSPPVEVVAVEAPRQQLIGCMDAINKDDENFLGIAVEQPPVAADKTEAETQSEENLQRYNRGSVPQQRMVQRGADNQFFYRSERGQITLATPEGDQPAPPPGQMLADDYSGGSQRGRAWRVREFEASEKPPDATRLAESRAKADSSPAVTTWGLTQRKLSALSHAKADMLQVLFVLHADDPATSAATAGESQGLQKQE